MVLGVGSGSGARGANLGWWQWVVLGVVPWVVAVGVVVLWMVLWVAVGGARGGRC